MCSKHRKLQLLSVTRFMSPTDIPDEDYILEWSTKISPNLSEAIGSMKSPATLARKLSKEISWRPPTSHGLENSAPIINTALGSNK